MLTRRCSDDHVRPINISCCVSARVWFIAMYGPVQTMICIQYFSKPYNHVQLECLTVNMYSALNHLGK